MIVRELEASLQQFGEFLLQAQLVKEKAAPFCVRWVRRFLTRPASSEPLADQVRRFCEELNARGIYADWQIHQAEHALRIYFVNFLHRTDWHRPPRSTLVDELGRTSPLAALEELRLRIRTRHYSYKTECSYADWVRRFFAYAAERQQAPHPRVDAEAVRDYLTYLAVRQQVSASTQNQALCALLFLCREVLGLDLDDLSATARAKRGPRLPTVLSVPETAALLGAMRGTPWLMAALIYGAACASPNAANCVSRTSTSIRDSSSCAAVRATRTARRSWPRCAACRCVHRPSSWMPSPAAAGRDRSGLPRNTAPRRTRTIPRGTRRSGRPRFPRSDLFFGQTSPTSGATGLPRADVVWASHASGIARP